MRKPYVLLVGVVAALVLAPQVALAADTDLENSESLLELSPLAVTIILGTLVPLLTGLVTKISAPDWLKGVVNLTLATIAGVVTQAVTTDGGAVVSDETLILAGLAWWQSVAAYYGVWRNFDVDAKLAPTKGLG